MGGVAGHLSHLQENLDFTFGEIKSILKGVASAEIDVVEKVDGQNLFFAYDAQSGQIRTARNGSDIAKGGMTPEEFASKWKGHPAEAAFTEGFQAIQQGLATLSDEERLQIFGPDGKNYVNAEIMYVDNPNIIVYGGNYIVLHNLHQFDESGEKTVTSRGPFQQLVNAVENVDDELGPVGWKTSGPRSVELQNIMDGGYYEHFVGALDALGMSDDATLGDYVEELLRAGPVGSLPISVNEQEGLIKLIVGKKGAMSLKDLKKNKPKEVQKTISSMATVVNRRKIASKLLAPVENAISDFAIEVLRGMASFFIGDHDAEIARMQQEVKDSIAQLESAQGGDAEAIGEMLEKQLTKLGDLEDTINSTLEGIVFEHPPGSEELYKLTGSFAMVNQIVGKARRTPKGDQQKESLLRNYIRLAIMAG